MKKQRAPEIAAALGSLVLSALVFARRPLPNNDGVYYLLAAEAFARDGLTAAIGIYPWPFHSVLIATAATVFGISSEAAAHGIGALFLTATSAAFVAVVRALGADRRVAWLAVAVVLCHPWLNRTRVLIVRDGGVWALGLLALLMLLRSDRGRRVSAVAGWAVCSALAVLFRADAAVLMVGGPFAIALAGEMEGKKRWPVALALFGAAMAALASAAAWLAAHPSQPGGLASLESFNAAAAAMATSFPLPYGREYAPFILAFGLLTIPVIKTLKTAGVAHLLLGGAGALRGSAFTRFHRTVLLATLGAAMAPLYFQVFRLLFVESRYTVFATLVLATWAPFGLGWLFEPEAPRGRRVAGGLLALGLALSLSVSLPLRPPPEEHVLAAANWIRGNAHGTPLHTNSLQIAWASGEPVAWGVAYYAQVHGALDGVDVPANGIWAVRVPAGDPALLTRLDQSQKFKPEARFVGTDGDTVVILRCAAETCRTGE